MRTVPSPVFAIRLEGLMSLCMAPVACSSVRASEIRQASGKKRSNIIGAERKSPSVTQSLVVASNKDRTLFMRDHDGVGSRHRD